jgi:GT2 family glycosyltransferase
LRASADQLALVTVTHNSAAELQTLLHSVAQHLPAAEVVVVDNASSDDSASVARSAGATVVALETNVGFGAACNRGVGAARAPITALINPDVELLDDSLVALASELRRDDRPERLLAPLVLNDDGSRQDSVHPVPGSGPDLARALVSPAAVPGSLGARLWPWRAPGPRQVGWAVACALVARTETLRRLGPFDGSLFMYGEDLELGLRAAQAGVTTWFWPAGRVVHHRAHSSERAFGGEPFERLARTRHEVVCRRLGDRRARLDDLAQAVTFGSRAAVKTALGRPAERERRQLAAVRSLSSAHGPDGRSA